MRGVSREMSNGPFEVHSRQSNGSITFAFVGRVMESQQWPVVCMDFGRPEMILGADHA